MGIIKQGILGGFSNAVGNIVGSSWKGIAVIKTKPLSVANPRTRLQVENRSAFSDASKLASQMLGGVIASAWNRFAKKQSGYNAWIQANVGIIKANGFENALEMLVMSDGELNLSDVSAAFNTETAKVVVSYSPAVTGRFDKNDDEVRLVIIGIKDSTQPITHDNLKIIEPIAVGKRSEGSLEFDVTLLEGITGGTICYAYVVSADGTRRSKQIAPFPIG